MKAQRLEELFNRYINRTATENEERELMLLLVDPELNNKKEDLIEAAYDKLPSEYFMSDTQADNIFSNITSGQKPVIRLFWKRWAVAASIILMVGAGSYFLFFNKKDKKTEIVKTTEPAKDVEAPKGTKAMITLANGEKVLLDSLTSGTLATQGNVNVRKTADGQIIYNGSSAEAAFNTLFNPRGSNIVPLTLSDGTKVWLNSESSIRYPVAFIGNERKVEITGEAYFEVATLRLGSGPKMPFRVKINEATEVEVLGTHFNVNAYADEASINTTLLEGSVRVVANKKTQLLNPGQQAQVNANAIKLINDADVEQAVAWKEGLFAFTDADLPTVMRQLARWYNIEVKYEGVIPEREFNGKIGKTLTLNQVLRVLTKTHINYRIENGNKIIIMP